METSKIDEKKKKKNLQSGIISSSISRVHKEYSICKAVMGWTAWALLIVSTLASDNPMYFIFPSSTSFLSSSIYHAKIGYNAKRNEV